MLAQQPKQGSLRQMLYAAASSELLAVKRESFQREADLIR